MLLSAVSVLVVAQSSSEIPEELMNNPVYHKGRLCHPAYITGLCDRYLRYKSPLAKHHAPIFEEQNFISPLFL